MTYLQSFLHSLIYNPIHSHPWSREYYRDREGSKFEAVEVQGLAPVHLPLPFPIALYKASSTTCHLFCHHELSRWSKRSEWGWRLCRSGRSKWRLNNDEGRITLSNHASHSPHGVSKNLCVGVCFPRVEQDLVVSVKFCIVARVLGGLSWWFVSCAIVLVWHADNPSGLCLCM